jgi:hypothetical protein
VKLLERGNDDEREKTPQNIRKNQKANKRNIRRSINIKKGSEIEERSKREKFIYCVALEGFLKVIRISFNIWKIVFFLMSNLLFYHDCRD